MIPPLFLTSLTLEDCKEKNDDNDGYIYNNNDVLDHDYQLYDGSLAGTGAGEGEFLTLDRGSGRRISDGECGTHDDSDYGNNIDKCNGFLSGHPHSATTGLSLGRLVSNCHLYIRE